ncbi:DNRLRE domain-containing protein [Nonomuraea typhae]|uniref:DNRLRE domain-containing protein n=1 Tax=Nonomuraea typhae TaxID=2603600 RepID=A0ABW7YS33_9ACTN
MLVSISIRRRSRLLAMALAVLMPVSVMTVPAAADPSPESPPSSGAAAAEPQLKAAWQQAASSGRHVWLPERSTESMQVWANPDGKTLSAEVHPGPIQLREGNGWQPIDTRVIERDGVLQAVRTKTPLTFGAKGGKTLVKAEGGRGSAGFGWSKRLPAPRIEGDQVIYPDAVAPGVDLVSTARPDGFTQSIVIRERPADPAALKAIKLPVTTPEGMRYGKAASGAPQLRAADGKPATADIVAQAVDANAERGPDEGRIREVATSVETSGGETALVLKPDPAFLADPAVTYPVTMTAPGEWVGAGQSVDAWVNKNNPTLNHLTDGWLRAGTTKTSADIARIYMRYPVREPLAGATIHNADLITWNYRSGLDPAEFPRNCAFPDRYGTIARKLTSSWDPAALSWNNQPSYTTSGQNGVKAAYSDTEGCSGGGELLYSIEEIVQSWANGEPDHGLVIMSGYETAVINWRQYYSREGGVWDRNQPNHAPVLFIQYTPAPKLTPVAGVYLKSLGESNPKTKTELNQWAARGRVSNTLPQPAPVTNLEDIQYRAASDQESTTPTDDLETPLPAPQERLTARWPFSEASGTIAADVSGNNHTATVSDGVAWTPGMSNSALTNVGVTGGLEAAPVAESTKPARITASQQAAMQKTAVEVVEETTETRITRAMPDGSFRTEITTGPVRASRGGSWVPLDMTLAEQGGKFVPRVLADGVAVEVSGGGTDSFVKMVADGKSYALRWPTPLPKPIVKGSVATYIDAAGAGADLVVTVLPTGFRHEVVLRERPAKPLELRIGVDDDGLTLTRSTAGRLQLKTGKGKSWGSPGQPAMWDGRAKGVQPLAKQAGLDTDVIAKDGRTELVLKPDPAFLADSSTVYPVRMSAAAAAALQHDVEVTMNDTVDLPATPTGTFLMAGTRTRSEKHRVHLRFDTTGLHGSTVTDAKLSLLNMDAPSCGPAVGAGIQARRLTAGWDPNNLYWANMPAATTEDAQTNKAAINPSCPNWPGAMDWNVTGIAQDWATGAANHGIVLQSANETTTNNYRVYPASEETTDFNNPPKLTITTSGPASSPTVSGLAITPAQSVGGTTMTSSLTPQLAATVADTIGGNLIGEFEVEHDPAATGQGTGQIWTGSSNAVASGGQAAVAIPAGKLTDGWKIRWRGRTVNTAASTTSAWSAWQQVTVDVPKPAVGAFDVTPSHVVDGKKTSPSLTPSLHSSVTDPAGQPLRAQFEVEHDPAATGQGSGQIWTGAIDNIVSGNTATVTVPADLLSNGWRLRWRARATNPATSVSSAWSNWQLLGIEVSDPSGPAITALQVSPSKLVDGTVVTDTLTPTLQGRVSDPAGGNMRAEFEVEHDPAATGQGSGQIWTGAIDNVASGGQAAVNVPAAKLTDGWKLRWRARATAGQTSSPWSPWQQVTVDIPKPDIGDLTIAPSTVINGTTITTSLTPTLSATVSHTAGQPLRGEFEVEHDPAATGQGSGQIWTGAIDNVASGGQAAVNVPAAKLTDGWKLRWRARATAGQTSSPWSPWQQVTVQLTPGGHGPLAQTSGPLINTDQSFTVGAWLKWSDKDGTYTALEQRGTHQAPFRLGNDPERGLVFTFTSADTTAPTVEGVFSDVEAPVNEWFHLAAVYTHNPSTATLYLNGRPIGSSTLSFASWKATGPLTLGTAITGSLDEVWVYDHDLIDDEIFALMDGSASAPSQGQTARNPVANSRYDRITPETCWENHGYGKRTYGLMKNRFSGCTIHEVSVFSGAISTDDKDDAVREDVEWLGRAMFVAKTFTGKGELDTGATTRDMWFDLYVGYRKKLPNIVPGLTDADLTIGMRPARDQSACRDVTSFQGGTQQNHLTMEVDDWMEAADKTDDGKWTKLATFRFRADPAHAPANRLDREGKSVLNAEKISNCVFTPYANIEDTGQHAVLFEYGTTAEKAQITCDSSRSISERSGGCTLPVIPSIEWRMGASYDVAYKHYWKACYQQADTFPKDSTKQIPGCAVGGTSRPSPRNYLWRTSDPVAKNSNARANTRCNDLWVGHKIALQECDEYPFASSGTRTADQDAERNLSVCAMPGGKDGPNQTAGRALRRFYDRDRVLYEQDFFNRFATKLTSVESMAQLCWKPLNTTSRFFMDQPKD